MKKPIGVSLNEDMVLEIDRHLLVKDASRSAFIRVCVSEKLEREKSEKVEKNEKTNNE